eukprot:10159784-Heterocapsa_arctica.AAC.1
MEDNWRATAVDNTPDKGWADLVDDIKDIAKDHFGVKPSQSTKKLEQRDRRKKLLDERMRLRLLGIDDEEVQEALKKVTNTT